jgi:hypothetical protein
MIGAYSDHVSKSSGDSVCCAAEEKRRGDRGRNGALCILFIPSVCPRSVQDGGETAAARQAAADWRGSASKKSHFWALRKGPDHEAHADPKPAESSSDISLGDSQAGHKADRKELISMQDLIFVACSAGFFAIAVAYVWACERLK